MSDKITHEELQKAATPLISLIKKYSHSLHIKVIVEEDYVEVLEGKIGLSIKEEEEKK